MFHYRHVVISAAAATLLAAGPAALAAEILQMKPAPESGAPAHRPVNAAVTGKILELAPGLTAIVKTGGRVRAVVIGNPNLVDASVINSGTVAITGKGIGATSLFLFDTEGREMSDYRIQVVRGEDLKEGNDVEARHEVTTIYSDKNQWVTRRYLCASNCSAMNDLPPLNSNPPTGAPPSSTTTVTTNSNVNSNFNQTVSGSVTVPPAGAGAALAPPPAPPPPPQ